ncbi:hypothetical protein [Anabaena sp. CA = ATCC 33047]|uniref:hypothetical protein n=1 Tax=Anabaena sp. (strain CA / ATCC 33047) TaxID=52271 RepID=UPI00082BF172|nr:hypothetical protein [Anabaena sp. CA = ATCC 33047]
MGNCTVIIVRAAFREIQKLSYVYFQDVAEILTQMSECNLGEYRKLEGYENLWRTKRKDVRVIWERLNSNVFLIIKAGLRKNVYKNIIENRDRNQPLTLADVLEIDERKVEDIPTYKWHNYQSDSWYEFVYGGYLYSPVLTNEQKRIFAELQTSSSKISSNFTNINSLLIQSAPGTGKTVCAALIACELYRDNWNIVLILPANLCDDIRKFTEIKKIIAEEPKNFFIGTFTEWLSQSAPDIYQKIATTSEELSALQAEARRRVHDIPRSQYIGYRELILYRSFVINRHKSNQSKHPIYYENESLINQLKTINENNRISQLAGKRNWIEGVYLITENAHNFPNANRTIFIFDEAQDYLIDELWAIIKMLERWQTEYYHTSVLCLLGDMNQRIQPVNFDWGQLQLNKRKCLQYNYRNTKFILKFANTFHRFAQKANSGRKRLPEISNPENTFEVGEPVRLLECNSQAEALEILEILSKKFLYISSLEQRSLLRRVSSRVKIIYKNVPEKYKNLPGLDYLNVQQAKGREFDVCVAFCVFNGQGLPTFEEANNWYTIFTRPRYRLLIIAITDEIERIGRLHFQECQCSTSQNLEALDWIIEWANGENLFLDIDVVCDFIYEGLNSHPLQISWDTYAALRLARVDLKKLAEIENNAIRIIQSQPNHLIHEELLKADNILSLVDKIPLKCLLLRALGNYWQAIGEAAPLKDIDFQEYQNLILRIADELENKGMLYEAARVRTKIGIEMPEHFPFRQEISNQDGSLVSLLCQAAIDKLYYKEINHG